MHYLNALLLEAAQLGHIEAVRLLLKKEADVATNNNEELRYATTYGHAAVVEMLQQHLENRR